MSTAILQTYINGKTIVPEENHCRNIRYTGLVPERSSTNFTYHLYGEIGVKHEGIFKPLEHISDAKRGIVVADTNPTSYTETNYYVITFKHVFFKATFIKISKNPSQT